MAAYVVRHAKAGDRAEWEDDDRLRPLTKSGRKQAEALVKVLKNVPIDKILSSPYMRCVQSLEPLATARKLPLETTEELAEGAGGERLLEIVGRHQGENIVLCTHGDLVEELLEILIQNGLVARSKAGNEKGGTWMLDEENGTVTRAKYLPAPQG